MSDAENSGCTYVSGALCGLLFEGVKWIKHATNVISAACNSKRCKLSEAEQVLTDSKVQSLVFCYFFVFNSSEYLDTSILLLLNYIIFCLQSISVSFPLTVAQLESAIQKHK